MELQPEWNEWLRLLKHHGVRFVMVGGLAVGVHGHERYTKELDVLVDPTEANARRLGSALTEFGFAATGRSWRRLSRPYQILTLGVAPVRIDVLTSISGVGFRAVWKGRRMVTTRAGDIPVMGAVERRLNKLATGRPQDLADVALLDAAAAACVSARPISTTRRRSTRATSEPASARKNARATRTPARKIKPAK